MSDNDMQEYLSQSYQNNLAPNSRDKFILYLFRSISVIIVLFFWTIICFKVVELTRPNGNTVVFITHTGEKYHTSSCKYLEISSSSITLQEADTQGYRACSICEPPEYISVESHVAQKQNVSLIRIILTLPILSLFATYAVLCVSAIFVSLFIDKQFWAWLSYLTYFVVLVSLYFILYT